MIDEKKMRIAITGNIGSGKSTFVKFISEFGYPVILADDVSKEILVNDTTVKKLIIQYFGAQSFNGNKVNSKFLADEVFADSKKLKKINSILHPQVINRIKYLTNEYFKASNIVFVEAALIFESNMEKMYNYIIMITASKDIRMMRSVKSKKVSENDFKLRDESQINEEIKRKKAHFTFTNNGSKAELKQKALLLIKLLEASF